LSGVKQLSRGELLFREGDASDACYVVKSGKIAIVKAKGSSEIELASIGPGQMFGEMAFFDSKPRSAGAKATVDATVVVLPFSALNAQFQGFPQWLKAMVKTVNENLREANKRIKNLEQAQKGDEKMFPPHTITKFSAILGLVCSRFGEKTPDGIIVSGDKIRNYTIQVFQEPTHKMQKIMEYFQGMGMLKIEDMGEGRQRIVVKDLDRIVNFTDFYNKFLFTDPAKRLHFHIELEDMKMVKALVFYGAKVEPDKAGKFEISLTQIQNESMKDLGLLVSVQMWGNIIKKGMVSEQISKADGSLAITCDLNELKRIIPFWDIVYAIEANDKK
jgi:CRP/FNR family cyclic AMP-dependent transcriptional regulator